MATSDAVHGTGLLLQGNYCSGGHAVFFTQVEGSLRTS